MILPAQERGGQLGSLRPSEVSWHCFDGKVVSHNVRETQVEPQKARKGMTRDEAGHLFL